MVIFVPKDELAELAVGGVGLGSDIEVGHDGIWQWSCNDAEHVRQVLGFALLFDGGRKHRVSGQGISHKMQFSFCPVHDKVISQCLLSYAEDAAVKLVQMFLEDSF